MKSFFLRVQSAIVYRIPWVLLPYFIYKVRRLDFESVKKMVDALVTNRSSLFYIIRSNQNVNEMTGLLTEVSKLKAENVIEVGTAGGGSLYMFSQVADDSARIFSIDIPNPLLKNKGGYSRWRIPLYKAFAKVNQNIFLIRKDSHDNKTREYVQNLLGDEEIDFLFIDGDHTYDGVKKDFEFYSPFVRKGGIVAFHDIVPGLHEKVGGVPDYWQELKDKYSYKEFVNDWNQMRYGIGVIYM